MPPFPPKKPILMYKMLIKGRFMICDRMSTFKSLEYFLLGIFRQLLGSEAINTARYKMYIDYINVSKFKLVFSQIFKYCIHTPCEIHILCFPRHSPLIHPPILHLKTSAPILFSYPLPPLSLTAHCRTSLFSNPRVGPSICPQFQSPHPSLPLYGGEEK